MRVAVKWVFSVSHFIILIAVTLIGGIFVIGIIRWFGVRGSSGGGFVVFLRMPNMILVNKITDRFFKSLGLSRSSRIIEVRRPAVPLERISPDDIVDINVSRTLSTTLMGLCLGSAFVVLLTAEMFIPKHGQTGREALPWLYGMFLGMASLGYGLRHFRLLRIDEQGVTASNTTVTWSDIATCKLVVIRDTLGNVSLAYPELKDSKGNELFPGLAQGMGSASALDQQKVLQIFKGRFPKLDADPWEL